MTGSDVPALSQTRSWWRSWRIAVAVCVALCVGAAAFVYRFNTLEGTLGGFGNDHFAQLMRTEMLLRGEQPLRDFADAELRGAWPALSYAVPAWAQQLGGRTFLSEAYLTVGALAAAYMIVFVLALDLSKRWTVALLVAATAVIMTPKLYNYSKVLMLALGALAIRVSISNPSTGRLVLAAVVTAVATLFRHDYGVYIAVGMMAGLFARDAGRWSSLGRRLAVYVGATALCLLPSAVWVQAYQGIPSYVRNALTSSAIEVRRVEMRLPQFGLSFPITDEMLLALGYYAFWGVLIVAGVLLISRMRSQRLQRLTPSERGIAAALLMLAGIVNIFFLRSNLGQRFGDAVIPVALLAAWSVGAAASLGWTPARALGTFAPVALLFAMIWAVAAVGDVRREFATAGLTDSWEQIRLRFGVVRENLLSLPPDTWSKDNAEGVLVAARYVAQCTSADDYLFVAAYAPEISVFARRRFAAGQGTVSLSFYTSDADQRRALARLESQSVPIVLADAREFEEGFVSDYPLLAQHFAHAYREAGTIVVDDEPRFLVFVDTNRQPNGVDPYLGLPCFK